MVSLEKCLEILNKNTQGIRYTKEEAKKIRDYLADFVDIELKDFKERSNGKTGNNLQENINQ